MPKLTKNSPRSTGILQAVAAQGRAAASAAVSPALAAACAAQSSAYRPAARTPACCSRNTSVRLSIKLHPAETTRALSADATIRPLPAAAPPASRVNNPRSTPAHANDAAANRASGAASVSPTARPSCTGRKWLDRLPSSYTVAIGNAATGQPARRAASSMVVSYSYRCPGRRASIGRSPAGIPRSPVWVSGTPFSAGPSAARASALPNRLLAGTPGVAKSRQPSQRTSGLPRSAVARRRMSAGVCWPSASAVTQPSRFGQTARQWAKAVLSAAPLPRLAGWRSTVAPSRSASAK